MNCSMVFVEGKVNFCRDSNGKRINCSIVEIKESKFSWEELSVVERRKWWRMSRVHQKKWRSVRNSSFNWLERFCKVNWMNWRMWPVDGSFYAPSFFSPKRRRFVIFQQCELKIFSSKICSLKGVFCCKFWVGREWFCVWKKINLCG